MSSVQSTDFQETVMKELSGLPLEKIHEVIDFIRFLKSKEDRERKGNICSEIIPDETEITETEEDRQAYAVALQELEDGNTVDFDSLKSQWLRGQSANV